MTITSPVWEAARRAILVAAIVWLVLSVFIVLSNVVFARPQYGDDGMGVVVAYLGGRDLHAGVPQRESDRLVFWTVAFAVIGAALAVAGGASVRPRSTPQT